MEYSEKIKQIRELCRELDNIEFRIAEIFGEKLERTRVVDKQPVKMSSTKKKSGCPECGSKIRRHKAGCSQKVEFFAVQETNKKKWECINCLELTKSIEKPERCEQCGGQQLVQKT